MPSAFRGTPFSNGRPRGPTMNLTKSTNDPNTLLSSATGVGMADLPSANGGVPILSRFSSFLFHFFGGNSNPPPGAGEMVMVIDFNLDGLKWEQMSHIRVPGWKPRLEHPVHTSRLHRPQSWLFLKERMLILHFPFERRTTVRNSGLGIATGNHSICSACRWAVPQI